MPRPRANLTAKAGRGFDVLVGAAGLFFVLAIAFAAYPAIKDGPPTVGGLLLLIGLACVGGFGIFAFGAPDRTVDDGPERLIDALDEPAAVVSTDGRIRAANAAWEPAVGRSSRLCPGADAQVALFSALNSGVAPAVALRTLAGDQDAVISSLTPGRLLVRLAAKAAPAGQAPAADDRDFAIPSPDAPPQGATFDALAAAAPFGAALIEGEDPFTAAIVEANPVLHRMAGEGAAEGRLFGALIEAASRADAAQRLAEGQGGPFEVRLAADPSRIAHLYLSRGEGKFVAYLVDVSEQKQIELQLVQSQKMQAIGQLAGGVAHDFNNLLTAIELRLDELLARHPVGDPSYEGLNQIRQTGARAADLVRKLLAFSRKQTVQRVTLDVGELISESQVLLGRLLPEDMKLETHYGRDLPKVRADKGQLETAIMNLVVNARDAVKGAGKGPGGVITVRTARLTHAEAAALGYVDPKATGGEVAMIEVADNGPGIPADVIGKIFDPFFTTKAVGEGTGLGLSTVYGIVKQADGWIEVGNGETGGAVFRIFLPVYIPPAGAPVVEAAKPARPAPRDLSGVGRILFVEDEDAVRGVAARLLRARGYEVIEAADGEEALALAEEHAGEIDLMISDVIMPGMDGPTLLKKARGYLGEAPVMFISGYAESDFSDLLEGEEGVTFLAKPIDIKTLAERVKQQLQAA
jgi:two-component system cell cycle sensor histidine kinase/response regulator CckA